MCVEILVVKIPNFCLGLLYLLGGVLLLGVMIPTSCVEAVRWYLSSRARDWFYTAPSLPSLPPLANVTPLEYTFAPLVIEGGSMYTDDSLTVIMQIMRLPPELGRPEHATKIEPAPFGVEVFPSLAAPIRLVRAQYLVELWEQGGIMGKRQDLPYWAFF